MWSLTVIESDVIHKDADVMKILIVALPPRTVDIYTLIDPTDGHVKYVGRSDNVRRRINQHIQQAFAFVGMSTWI